MLPVPKKWGQGWYPAQKICKRLPRVRRKTNRNANRRVRVYNGPAKYRNNCGDGGGVISCGKCVAGNKHSKTLTNGGKMKSIRDL